MLHIDAAARFSVPIVPRTPPRCLASSSTILWGYAVIVTRSCTTRTHASVTPARAPKRRTRWTPPSRRRRHNRWRVKERRNCRRPRRKISAVTSYCKRRIRKHNRPSQRPRRIEKKVGNGERDARRKPKESSFPAVRNASDQSIAIQHHLTLRGRELVIVAGIYIWFLMDRCMVCGVTCLGSPERFNIFIARLIICTNKYVAGAKKIRRSQYTLYIS